MISVACMDEGDRQISIQLISTVVSRNRYSLTHFPGAPFFGKFLIKISVRNSYISLQVLLGIDLEQRESTSSIFVKFDVDRDSRVVKQRWGYSKSFVTVGEPASGIEPHRLEWSFEVQTSWAPQRRKASTPISIDRFAAHRQIRLVAAFLPGLPSYCLKLVRFPNWFLRFLIVIDSGLEISVFSASPSPSSQSQWSLRAKLPISDEYSISSAYAWSTAHTRVLSRAFVRIIEI